ncbi:MAG TPA: 3-hydroxyacyl-CoA dehydrogenase family protein [Nitriliruptorales bacterium]|nr:3-hydroxyacyl-CoA dehydrogenase family protein [Nitriliruptorales bacterium]
MKGSTVAEDIRKVGVVGCGTMGSGISEIVARKGMDVVFVEVDDAAVDAGRDRIAYSLQRLVDRGKLDPAEREEILSRITGSTKYAALSDVDLVIEAVPEDLELKQQVMARVDEHLPGDTIIATNTSSLPVLDIAVRTRHPNHVLGFHFFNPAPVMRLIELVRTPVTDGSILSRAREFALRIGKTPVVVGDRAGFIANQLLFPYLNQAIGMVASGYATKEDVDSAMRLGAGHPMGPIALADLIGIDTMLGITEAIWSHFRETRFSPQPILRQLTSAGFHGRKTGRGFYQYEEPGAPRIVDASARREPADGEAIADWSSIGVVGTGTMAIGVAQVFAQAGYRTVIRGRGRHKAEAVVAAISKGLQRLVDKGRISEQDRVDILGRLEPTGEYGDLADCDLVLEAVAEDLEVKRGVFAEVEAVAKDRVVLATTTSSLPVIDCAMATRRPERVVGLHFFNPAAVMKLVEVVPTVRSETAVVEQARAVVERCGKVGVLCQDRAGFIVNALLFPYLNDAVNLLASHYATVEQIDTAMKLGTAHPMGPFELIDIVGLDVTLAIIERLHAEFRQPSLAPAPLLRHMVEAGFLGRKAGRGFYVYR